MSLVEQKGTIRLNPEISTWRIDQSVDATLKHDLDEKGQLQDIIARVLPNGALELVAGHRRYMALKDLGKKDSEINFKILENLSDREAILYAISENAIRENLSPLEEGRSFRSLKKLKMSNVHISKLIHKSEAYVRRRLSLLEMPKEVQELIQAGKVDMGYAIPLKRLNGNPQAQIRLAKRVGDSYGYIQSIKEMETAVTQVIEGIKKSEELVIKYGACPKCGSNLIEESPYYDKEKLQCEKCHHTWHRETKDPWAIYQLKERAEGLGLDLDITGSDGAKLTVQEVTTLVDKNVKLITAITKPNPSFRSNVELDKMVLPFIAGNLQKIDINGEKITLTLIEDSGLHFNAIKKDYREGEKCRVTVTQGWQDNPEDKLPHRIPVVQKYLKTLEEK